MSWAALLWWRPPCLLRRVIVNLRGDDAALEGVLWGARGAWLTLKDARALYPGREPAAVDGEIVVHRDRVSFLQVLP